MNRSAGAGENQPPRTPSRHGARTSPMTEQERATVTRPSAARRRLMALEAGGTRSRRLEPEGGRSATPSSPRSAPTSARRSSTSARSPRRFHFALQFSDKRFFLTAQKRKKIPDSRAIFFSRNRAATYSRAPPDLRIKTQFPYSNVLENIRIGKLLFRVRCALISKWKNFPDDLHRVAQHAAARKRTECSE